MQLLIRVLHILILATILLGSIANASDKDSRWHWHDRIFKNYTANEGLPHGGASSMVEDSIGFIWLITSKGLMRFDGKRFEHVPITFEDIPLTPRQIIVDAHSNFWLAHENRLFRLNPFTRLLEEVKQPIKGKISYLSAANRFDKSDIWGATTHGIFKVNIETLTVETFFEQQMLNWPNLRTFSIFSDNNSMVWLGTTHGLFLKKANSSQFEQFDLSEYLDTSQRISAITQTQDNVLWVATPRNGLVRIDSALDVTKPFIKDFKNEWFYSLEAISSDLLWIGTFGQGVIELNTKTNDIKRIKRDRLNAASLANNDIWQILQTSTGLIWVAHKNGVSIHNPNQSLVKSAIGDTSNPLGIRDAQVSAIELTKDNNILLGLREKGVDVITPQSGLIEKLTPDHKKPQHNLPAGAVETISISDQHGTYLGSNWGIYRYDQQTINRVETDTRSSGIYTGTLLADIDYLWLGGTEGLWRFTPKGDELVDAIHVTQSNQLSDNRISTLLKTPNDELIVGTWSGINWVNSSGDVTYQVNKQINNRLHNAFIADMVYDNQSQLWIATEGNGVFIGTTDKYPKNFTQLTTEHGLSSNVNKAIVTDQAGNIWLSSNGGIDIINPRTLKITQLSKSYYHLLPPYNKGAVKQLDTGELLFGGTGGLTIINPSKLEAQASLPKVVITRATLGNTLIHDPKIGINEDHINIVPAQYNRFEFEFSTLGVFDFANISYRYRLLGLRETWHTVDSEHRNITYTTLPPGNYQLELQNKSAGANWNKASTIVNINVLPHWYQTFWAKLAAAIIAIALVVLIVNIYITSLRRRRDYLEHQVTLRTRDLEETTEQLRQKTAALIEASVTDPLTSAYNRRFLERNIHNEVALVHRHYHQLGASQHTISEADIIFYLIDIDYFKKVNDQYGHQVGDEVLIEFTHRLNKLARESDYVIRWGGEEFLLVVREGSRDRADKLAKRIHDEINQQPFLVKNQEILLSCSIGYVPFPFCTHNPAEVSWQQCIELADKALYIAKDVGRNSWIGINLSRSISAPEKKINIKEMLSSVLDFSSNIKLSIIQKVWDETKSS